MLVTLVLIVLGLAGTISFADDAKPPKPDSHTERNIEGWIVRVDDRLLSEPNAALGESGLKVLANRLCDVKAVVPPEKVKRLQQVPIWLDLTHGDLRSAQYHPSAGWLKEHGYASELAKSVHIPDASDFFAPRHQHEQPWALMHELAHAYHDQVLDFEHPQIKAAWGRFKESGRYKQVIDINGRQRPHYALTNQMEFFAEMTEAYFGMNDFFPFNRAELKQQEPEVFQLMQDLWGPLP